MSCEQKIRDFQFHAQKFDTVLRLLYSSVQRLLTVKDFQQTHKICPPLPSPPLPLNDTGDKFFAGVVDTAKQLITGVNDTGDLH
jgi:hypothetical protein